MQGRRLNRSLGSVFFFCLCFAKILCALKILRFPAATAAQSGYPFTLECHESLGGEP